FHFFLDGLDEKVPSQQAALAQWIVDLARGFPEHRFTVSSRPIDAVEVFAGPRTDEGSPDGEWRVLELAPDWDWQRRYLEAAGVTLDALEAEMPALRD